MLQSNVRFVQFFLLRFDRILSLFVVVVLMFERTSQIKPLIHYSSLP
jgi:hypothetical protein